MFINDLANELHISKVAVTKRIKALGLFDELEKVGNKYQVPDDVANQVRKHYSQTKTNQTQTNENELAFYIKQIELKDQQILSLQREVEKLTDALTQEQQLHAHTKQEHQLLLESRSSRSFLSFFHKKKPQ